MTSTQRRRPTHSFSAWRSTSAVDSATVHLAWRCAIASDVERKSIRGDALSSRTRIAAPSARGDGRNTVSEWDWGTALLGASALCALCAVTAAAVSVAAWRRARDISEQVAEMRSAVERIETVVETEEKHILRPRDLGAIHEKINRVAEDLAAARAQSNTQTKMLNEQLRLLQRLVQDNLSFSRNSRS